MHGENNYDVAEIEFYVTIREEKLGKLKLKVDHAMHREAEQNNVTTVLAWGSKINHLLTSKSHIDDWVLIERGKDGSFKLTIQEEKPNWTP